MIRSRGLRSAVATAAALVLVLGACSSSKKKSAKVEELTLRLGVLFTTSGKGGDLAQAVLGAIGLATEDAGTLKVKLSSVQADYAGDPNLIPKAMGELKGKVDAIVVGTDDPAVVPHLEGVTDVPVIHTLMTRDDITDRPNVFSVAPSNTLLARKVADYLVTKRKFTKIATLSDTTDFGQRARAAFESALSSAQVAPTLSMTFAPGGDIHTPVAHAGQLEVESMAVNVDSPGEAARIVVEVQKMGFPYQLALSGNLATATFAKNASAQVTPVAFRDGMLSVGTWAGPWFNLPRVISYYTRFQTANSAQAPVQSAAVYDAASLLARVARDRGAVAATDLISGLESTTDFEAAGVPITFTKDKHEGIDLDDLAIYGYTKDQDSAGGAFFPDVDTGGGFFTIVTESLDLPARYRFLTTKV